MKKLMIVLVAAAVAAYTQAASFNWKTSATGKVYQPGSATDFLGTSTAYLFDVANVTQSSLVADFAAGTLDLASKSGLSNATISNGKISGPTFVDGTAVGDTLTAYFATIITVGTDDYLFISGVASAGGVEGKTTAISFNAKAASQLTALDASAGYKGAGWYTTQSVPEPTSGLLMLLGVAGLALRRRRV